jgi:hypothetical protein
MEMNAIAGAAGRIRILITGQVVPSARHPIDAIHRVNSTSTTAERRRHQAPAAGARQ